MQYELEPRKWRADFRKRHGHNPKVLFIGNVANNAYQIAKLLNNAKIECDVLCNDYYHIMGSPEWEDADIKREGINQFYPKFSYNGGNKFKRPRWFAQGPFEDAIEYLIARRKNKALGYFAWKKFEESRMDVIEHNGVISHVAKVKIYPDWLILVGYKCAEVFRSEKLKYKVDRITNAAWHKYRAAFMTKFSKDWQEAFPDRKELGWSDECDMWLNAGYKLQPLMEYYDVVVGFGGSVLLPYFAGFENYVAFEHGTIRGFRELSNDSQPLLMLAYAKSKVLYNTNTDCFDDAEYITKNTGSAHFCGLHGIGINELLSRLNNSNENRFRKELNLSEDDFLILCPARHDYDEKSGTYIKGDEKVAEAIGALAHGGHDFTVVMINWGRDCIKYKAEIEKDDALKKHMIWIDPLGKADFEEAICSCDVILDQFNYSVFGAIAIEAMLGGKAVLVNHSIESGVMKNFFSSTWPILEADTSKEIEESITEVLLSKEKQKTIAERQFQWVTKEHSADRIARLVCGSMALALKDSVAR